MMQEGLTDKQVLARLQERFGPSVVNPPQPWVTLIVPFLPFVVGFLVVAWAVRRWLRKGSDEPQETDGAPPDDEDRLERLRRHVAYED